MECVKITTLWPSWVAPSPTYQGQSLSPTRSYLSPRQMIHIYRRSPCILYSDITRIDLPCRPLSIEEQYWKAKKRRLFIFEPRWSLSAVLCLPSEVKTCIGRIGYSGNENRAPSAIIFSSTLRLFLEQQPGKSCGNAEGHTSNIYLYFKKIYNFPFGITALSQRFEFVLNLIRREYALFGAEQ